MLLVKPGFYTFWLWQDNNSFCLSNLAQLRCFQWARELLPNNAHCTVHRKPHMSTLNRRLQPLVVYSSSDLEIIAHPRNLDFESFAKQDFRRSLGSDLVPIFFPERRLERRPFGRSAGSCSFPAQRRILILLFSGCNVWSNWKILIITC